MSSLEDEFARFESELNSIAADTPAAPKEEVDQRAIPAGKPIPSLFQPPPVLGAGAKMGGTFSQSFIPPMPQPGAVPGMFVPNQIRLAPTMAPAPKVSAVLEAGPTLYKDEELEKEPVITQTFALPQDIIAMEQKKSADIRKLNQQKNEKNKNKKAFLRCGGGQVWEDLSLAEWDPADFRIFCGDLGNEVSDELLAKAFRKYPSFQRAKVVRDSRTNKSKGYGFVSFKDADDYARAMREMDGKYVGNRPIKLRKSSWKERQFEVVAKKQKQKAKLGLW
ncbi:unnamed protein product [Auanema sp. JU1783]|nr:unnamed protein product [Auanema sp. JU1783]